MSKNDFLRCCVCHSDDIRPGPREDLLRCTTCRSLLVREPSGLLREWLSWLTAGRGKQGPKARSH